MPTTDPVDVAGPTTGDVADSPAGQKVIADEAAAELRADGLVGEACTGTRAPAVIPHLMRFDNGKGVLTFATYFENGTLRHFSVPVAFNGDTFDQFTLDGTIAEVTADAQAALLAATAAA